MSIIFRQFFVRARVIVYENIFTTLYKHVGWWRLNLEDVIR